MINIVLLEPEIAENTGNIGRTCVCADSALHIIEPTKFKLTKEYLKRSGMDYWDRLKKYDYINYIDFLCKNDLLDKVNVKKEWIEKYDYIIDDYIEKNKKVNYKKEDTINKNNVSFDNNILNISPKIYFATTKAHKTYCDVRYNDGDYIMFGKESAGIDEEILSLNEDKCIRIPMYGEERSLNLSNSVAIVLYEALRQQGFSGLKYKGELHKLQYI